MTYPVLSDEYFMNEALKEAQKAFDAEEVPVGAVIVNQNRIIARAHNMTQQLTDVTAHAEMIAITSASKAPGLPIVPLGSLPINIGKLLSAFSNEA